MTDKGAVLVDLVHKQEWDAVLELCLRMGDAAGNAPALVHFARGKALLEKGHPDAALASVGKGRRLSPDEEWGLVLEFEALLAAGRLDAAFSMLGAFIDARRSDTEALKRLYVDRCVDHDRWDLALVMNERRTVILPDRARDYAVAVQCFNKTDTLDALFGALVRCQESDAFDLVVFQDSAEGSAREAQYAPASAAVREVIARWLPALLETFRTVEFRLARANRGTAPSCRQLLDHVCAGHEGFVFLEDDCILAEDALRWALHHLRHSIGPDRYWFASCESVFFNSEGVAVADEQLRRLQHHARQYGIHSAHVELDFVPSTCFITTRKIWEKTRNVRSFPHGPESLNAYLRRLGRKTLSPVVPRARDIGMLHDLGYSVAMLGKDRVREVKNTYLLSDGMFLPEACRLYSGNRDRLWLASCRMRDDQIAALAEEG